MRTSPSALWLAGLILVAAESAVGADAEKEKQYVIKIEEVKAQPTVTIRFRTTVDKIADKYAEAFTAVMKHVASKDGQPAGAPFGRYHAMIGGQCNVEAGIPVVEAMEGQGEVKASQLPGGTAATTVHTGPYEKLSAAHEAIQNWARKNGHKPIGGVWEYYLTDPGQEPDPNKWQTKLYLLIATKETPKPK
jgi:effector-binding domain-containing protein